MSDLFHEDVPLSFIQKVFYTINRCPNHTFQILTKRSDILRKYASSLEWSDNIWIGVSVETEQFTHRIDDLRCVPTENRFISIEPLLGPIKNLSLSGINWIIVGGESGYGCRMVKKEWIENIFKDCKDNGVPFFFKQWGGVNKKKSGRQLFDREWNEVPSTLRKALNRNVM
ncbi:Phage Gp37Gp68 [Candidatus Magnetoovum chiemensis]|nr:Phage Gp37Gp68 [Candidatus Magnetoovum chiemensis]